MTQKGVKPLISGTPAIKGWKDYFYFVSFSSIDDRGLSSWGKPANFLPSTPKLSTEEEADFEVLNKFVVPNLEWLLLEESLQRMGFSRLLECKFEKFFFYSVLFSLYFLSVDRSIDMRSEDVEAETEVGPEEKGLNLLWELQEGQTF